MLITDVVQRLRSRLLVLERTPDAPHGDAGWLRLRCDDTLGYKHEYRRALLRQLKKDVAEFNNEHPGLLSRDLLEAVENMSI